MTGKKRGAFNMDFQIVKVKEACTVFNCTVNELCSSLISLTLHEYFKKHTKTDDPINGLIPK